MVMFEGFARKMVSVFRLMISTKYLEFTILLYNDFTTIHEYHSKSYSDTLNIFL